MASYYTGSTDFPASFDFEGKTFVLNGPQPIPQRWDPSSHLPRPQVAGQHSQQQAAHIIKACMDELLRQESMTEQFQWRVLLINDQDTIGHKKAVIEQQAGAPLLLINGHDATTTNDIRLLFNHNGQTQLMETVQQSPGHLLTLSGPTMSACDALHRAMLEEISYVVDQLDDMFTPVASLGDEILYCNQLNSNEQHKVCVWEFLQTMETIQECLLDDKLISALDEALDEDAMQQVQNTTLQQAGQPLPQALASTIPQQSALVRIQAPAPRPGGFVAMLTSTTNSGAAQPSVQNQPHHGAHL